MPKEAKIRNRRAMVKVKRATDAAIVKPDENVSIENVEKWHQEVFDHLDKANNLDILEDSQRIFNLKEVYFPIDPTYPTSSYVTTVIVVAASGVLVPQTVFFPSNELLPPVNIDGSETNITVEESNGIDNLFVYMQRVFHPWLISNNIDLPVAVFLDSVDVPIEVLGYCKSNEIILLNLVPTVHSLHPIKSHLLHQLQRIWIAKLLDWKTENGTLAINSAPELLGQIFDKVVTTDRVKKAFEKSGIYPFNPILVYKNRLACLSTSLDQDDIETVDLCQSSPIRISHSSSKYRIIRQAESQESNIEKTTQTAGAAEQCSTLVGPLVYEFLNNSGNYWNGAIENTSLFQVWQQLSAEHRLVLQQHATETDSAHRRAIDQKFRMVFERSIGPLVYEFRKITGQWSGAPENTALFEVWQQLASMTTLPQ